MADMRPDLFPMKREQVRAIVEKLNSGCAVYIHTGTNSYPVARIGITPAGEVWYQNGGAAHLAGPVGSCVEVGCGWSFERNGHRVTFVLPEDADEWELGALMTALESDRKLVTLAELLETV